jgi:hypothetical protein
MTMFTLYYAPNTCALASHIALVDAGAPYALKLVDFGKTEQRQPDYLKVNPKARVPSLATNSAMGSFIARANCSKIATVGFSSPRSIRLMYVRSMPASTARFSCDRFCFTRIRLRFRATSDRAFMSEGKRYAAY